MSRGIEFRAWLKDEKKMITEISSIKLDINCIYYDNNQMFSYERASFDDIELMQWTGKKDKNGTEIFEHDLIQLDGTSYIYEIMWDNESSSYKMQNKNDTFEWDVLELRTFKTPYITCLGNVYENEELLGEK